MHFEWDETKNRRNLAKHGISFEIANSVFEDPFALSIQDCVVEDEERWQTLGAIGGVVVVLVAHTHEEEGGEEVVRLISARKATPLERRAYEKSRKGQR
jgi:uncharacterized DUF497 family protein